MSIVVTILFLTIFIDYISVLTFVNGSAKLGHVSRPPLMRHPQRVLLFALCLLSFLSHTMTADTDQLRLGISTGVAVSYLRAPDADASLETLLTAAPLLNLYAENVELSCEARIAGSHISGQALPVSGGFISVPSSGTETASLWRSGDLELRTPRLSNCRLSLFPHPAVTISAGRYRYTPGAGELFTALDLFTSMNPDDLLSFDNTAKTAPSALLQSTLFLRNGYVTLSAQPWKPPREAPLPSSPWFPRNYIPEEIPLESVLNAPLSFTRRKVELQAPGTQVFDDPGNQEPSLASRLMSTARRGSYAIELGASLAHADAGLLLYHGWDNRMILRPRIFVDLQDQEYSVVLEPLVSRFTGLGGTVTSVFGSFRAWADSLWSFNRKFVERHYVAPEGGRFQLLATTGEYPGLDLTTGLSRQWPWRSLVSFVEYTGSFALVQEPTYPMAESYLSHTLTLGLHGRFLDHRFRPQLVGITSLNDGSSVVLASIRYALLHSMEIVAAGAAPLGASDTELGQFRGYVPITLSLIRHF